jgi:hypothetical protein
MAELVTVRGQLTLEETGVVFTIGMGEAEVLERITPRDDEWEHYAALEKELQEVVEQADEPTSRQLYVAKGPVVDTKMNCMAYVQVLKGRRQNKLIVTMRSSSATRMRSDLGMVARLMLRNGCSEAVVTLGSFHVELFPQELRPNELRFTPTS